MAISICSSVAARFPGAILKRRMRFCLRNEGGRFVPMQRWEKLGLVCGAVFSDLDQDGLPELVLATDEDPCGFSRWRTESMRSAPANGD